ncbi:hypothetical protein GY632_1707 [Trichophyton interdigitale]|uniref:Uncharacterized protein n=1 Tax=Trichophyton interdigitale TaxID=101480 RepID=A0A9P4YJ98_9EURO|nr:hypothetical protein GY632_1707 [Trichophyton interdigitale]
MASLSPTTVFVALVLIYISSFVLFAILRIATGVSIQRIGYFSLRHIAYSPREGVYIKFGGIGISVHRPSLVQPTYVSLRIKRATVALDLKALASSRRRAATAAATTGHTPDGVAKDGTGVAQECDAVGNSNGNGSSDGKAKKKSASWERTWKILKGVKERLKRLLRQIKWLALIDISATETTLRIRDAGELHIGALTMSLDARRKVMQGGKQFRQNEDAPGEKHFPEWIFNARNILLAVDGCEHKEIFDNIGINVHGLLQNGMEGLREVSISVKVGRLHIPYDDVRSILLRIKLLSLPDDMTPDAGTSCEDTDDETALGNIMEESDTEQQDTHQGEEVMAHHLTESKAFLTSLIRGIQDFQLALSFFRVSSTVENPEPMEKPLYLNFYTHEVGVDFHRMDPAHPSHRMYFQRDDVAHQALIAAISSSVSLGENIDEHDKLIYIPMATTTIKTTLPSKTMALAGSHRDAAERNSNVIFANFVVTSPSVDLEPKHLSNILALIQARGSSPRSSSQKSHFLMSRLLPKAVIKLSVHEPVLRFALPTSDSASPSDYNLLVSSISSISLDVESSHSIAEGAQYSLVATYRISSHLIYYQTAAGVRHRLLATDTMDLKCYINATTEIAVAISGSMNSFSIHILSGELTRGLHQAVEQLKRLIPSKHNSSHDTPPPSLLRRLPPWLIRFQFESSAFSIEIAGSDPTVGSATRGIVLHLGEWSVEYQLQKPKPNPRSLRRRTPSHSAISDDSFRFTPTSPSGKSYSRPSDGRRVTFNVSQLESFIMESVDYMEPDAFLSVPQFEIALTTSSDLQGPIFHVNSIINEIIVKHSLYRCYAIGIAATIINDAFFNSTLEVNPRGPKRRSSSMRAPGKPSKVELTTFDIKVPSVQVQGVMPSDPRILLQVYGLVAGRHRWSPPFIRSHLIRLHVESPKAKGTWTRIISVGGIRIGLRESRTKQAESLGTTKSYDISSDFIRVAVPPHMIMYRVFDNFVNTFKALELLNYRMKTKSSSPSMTKPPSGPKCVPKISLRSKSIVFEIEDDPFEWKLGCIYRLGLQEQKQRLAREEAYHMKLKKVIVDIVPPSLASDGTMQDGFSLDVRRTVAPVKTYSNPTIEINTNQPTTISWGMSYQPVIQDVMKIIENFTKPEIDPSERVGFWDKIRLSFHSRLLWVWKGDGDVHFRLKGSRDPYIVTGFGAGFVMCWRKDVQWGIRTNDDPQEFFAVTSGEYVLAIPDYNRQARYSYESPSFNSGTARFGKSDALFKKVIMKLSGNVRWLAGLVFERNANGAERCFDFKPHYEVVLRNPMYLSPQELKDYDAFRGFRSNHIHLSLAVVAPVAREWTLTNREPSASYNTVHLTPKFFTHFFSWWSLFSGVMSLPVRQGPLFPGLTKTSKKFSRHLGTIKYKLFLSPLFVSHIYKHKDPEDYKEDIVYATGLKVRLDSFMLDLHQRREYTTVVKGRLEPTKASSMKINRAQLDFISADCRAVSSIGNSAQDSDNEKDGTSPTYPGVSQPADISNFTIPDEDLNWIDMDDFVELDWVLPVESNPRTQILPLAYSPRFSFFRQTDHTKVGPDEPGYSPFGDEPTHVCVMSQDHDPRRVQIELLKERLNVLEAQSSSHHRVVGEFELRSIRNGIADEESRRQYETMVRHGLSLEQRQKFLQDELQRLEMHFVQNGNTNESSRRCSENADLLISSTEDEFASDFDNRFVIHNIQLKWNNSLRNIILRYIHQVNQRRGFVYYMSRRAVKFILDIVDEQVKAKRRHMGKKQQTPWNAEPRSHIELERDDDMSTEERIEQLLNDASRFVNAEPPTPGESKHPTLNSKSSSNISPEFTPQNSYHLRLIAPQIQLQSEKNKKSVAVVTAKGMQLKVVSIMDKHRVSDDVSGLVQRQFTLSMDSAQFFVADQKSFSSHIHIYCGNGYGNAPGTSWPPWVSVEAMFDFDIDLSGFSRIIQKTSASLRYDKFNTLRLKFNEKVAGEAADEDRHAAYPTEHRIDQITVDFPQVRAICDSSQYYSLYIIALDLLMYSEPREQVRTEKLEKIMLASDFSDLRGAPEIVNRLQQRIRYLEEIKSLFQIRGKYLDKQGLADRVSLEKDLITCEDELFFMMKAITTSQRKSDDRAKSASSGLLHWTLAATEIVWHLMTNSKEPIAEFQLRDAAYGRTDNSDGSNYNTIEVGNIYGLNLLPEALYPQVILPYKDNHRGTHPKDEGKMLQVKWYMLEAIAGIPVLNDFEVTLFPLKIQLERELGQKLFEYAFPAAGPNAFENGGFSPFMIKQIDPPSDDSEVDNTTSGANTPAMSTASASADERPPSRLGTVEQRLMPTLALPDKRRSHSPGRIKMSMLMTPIIKDPAPQKRKAEDDRSRSTSQVPTRRTLAKKASADSLTVLKRQASDWSLGSQAGNKAEEKPKRPTLKRPPTKVHIDKAHGADDLSRMISRASNFMILTHVKINDVVLCLSYKGKGERNIEDIHDFVFRLPVLEYRNKSWSNLDLALRLKKDAIKALISHAPAILGNKFSHHRPNKQQQKRLRELASSSQLLDGQSVLSNPQSDGSNSVASRTSTERSASPDLSLDSHAFQTSGAPSTDSMGIPPRSKTAHSDIGPMGSSALEDEDVSQRSH